MPATLPRPFRTAGGSARRHAAAAAALLVAGLAGGCGGSDENKFPPVCPALSLLRDAADLTRFAGAGSAHDASSLVLAARITAVPAKCETGDPGQVRATLSVAAEMVRGPAASGDTAQVPYFIALTEAGRVLNERDFTLAAQFRPNADRVSVKGEDIELLLPVSKAKTAAAYHIYVGFRLTPEELAYNRGQAAR